MAKSPLFGRRIHIAGRIADDLEVAPTENVRRARELVVGLVKDLIKKGATFVVPVDAEPLRSGDEIPLCFDWLVWETIRKNVAERPAGSPNPMIVAVQHHKSEEKIPEQYINLWDGLRDTDLVKIENAAHWNMASKRMEVQARWGDILITLGGGEGVLFLGNLYHDAGKPVVPLNLKLCEQSTGARKLFDFGLVSNNTRRLFTTEGLMDPHSWLNRINFAKRIGVNDCVNSLIELLEALEAPKVFAVRLLNPAHPEFKEVDEFFDMVVKPVVEGEMGFKLTVIDQKHQRDAARVDQEIFEKLHRSSVVIADITGERPNCYVELGYALGRALPTILTVKDGVVHRAVQFLIFGDDIEQKVEIERGAPSGIFDVFASVRAEQIIGEGA